MPPSTCHKPKMPNALLLLLLLLLTAVPPTTAQGPVTQIADGQIQAPSPGETDTILPPAPAPTAPAIAPPKEVIAPTASAVAAAAVTPSSVAPASAPPAQALEEKMAVAAPATLVNTAPAANLVINSASIPAAMATASASGMMMPMPGNGSAPTAPAGPTSVLGDVPTGEESGVVGPSAVEAFESGAASAVVGAGWG
ncbi:MAG: hypothetical protein Q9164_001813, partial [Protoblastenia rupestris]